MSAETRARTDLVDVMDLLWRSLDRKSKGHDTLELFIGMLQSFALCVEASVSDNGFTDESLRVIVNLTGLANRIQDSRQPTEPEAA